MDDCAGAGPVNERGVLADAVVGLHFEAPPVGPHRRTGAGLREQVPDLVGFDGMVEGRHLVAELFGHVENY